MDAVARIRSFNRVVTQQIGALDTRFLGRSRPLGASRLLFEIGRDGGGVDVRDLRSRLDLDSGYMSRLLRGLEGQGLVRTGPATGDARVRVARLTSAGRRELAVLNRLSDRAAASLLQKLSDSQRGALTAAMESVERLLTTAAVQLQVVSPKSRAARFCLDRYYEELAERFDAGFDPAKSISAAAEELTPPRGYFVLATLHGEPVGCGALKCHREWGEVKRMWVAKGSRGLGIGKRILQRLEALALRRRISLLRLETNRALTEAQKLYQASGYREVRPFNTEPYAHHWFEKTLRVGR